MPLTITKVTTDDSEFRHARTIRREVFVDEQNCPPEEEWDGNDGVSHHYLGRLDGKPIATARWRVIDHGGAPVAKLERFAVLRDERGRGYGRRMVEHLMEAARGAGHGILMVHAQAHLEEFYGSFGFVTVGEPFEEVGIPHVEMVLHK